MTQKSDSAIDAFRVTRSQSLLEGLVHGSPRCARWLGNLESKVYRRELEQRTIDRPVFIGGLARSGSTILLEALAAHPAVGTHRYRDFPLIFTPCWSQAIQNRTPGAKETPTERAHGDGIAVTLDSPEAMEEPIWMSFFPEAHDPARPHVLDESTDHPAFERFYRDHLRKILLVRDRPRYVAKGNYNTTRMRYLLKLFPDAKFVLPIRHPRGHIASLRKQQRLFDKGETAHPRALKHMRRVGHFEFGLDRRPINVGRPEVVAEIASLWKTGEEIRGWARYWAYLYGWVHEQLRRDEHLSQAVRVVRFEDLCDDPTGELAQLLDHCGLDECDEIASFADGIHAPTYYRADFTPDEEQVIAEETDSVAAMFGYETATTDRIPGQLLGSLVETHAE